MKYIYLTVAHVINLALLGLVAFLGIALFINISTPDPNVPDPNPINIGIWFFILFIWGVSYRYQFQNPKWKVLLFANLLFIIAVAAVILVILPLLFNFFYL